MCTTCGCGIGQTLIAGHAIQRPRKPAGEMHYRVREEGAAHAHPHGHTHDPIDSGAGPAGTHAPGMSQARMVKIERDILAKNNGYADENRRYFVRARHLRAQSGVQPRLRQNHLAGENHHCLERCACRSP